jgi:metal-responsive CopG/Arc/MetJ family transcriptional regulator
METIQVVIDSKLLRSANVAARRSKQNRSALIREALREHLHRMKIREMEERDRKAYEAVPENKEDLAIWETEIAWPEE